MSKDLGPERSGRLPRPDLEGRARSRSPSNLQNRVNYRSRTPQPNLSPENSKCGNSKCGGEHELRDCPGPPSPAGDIIGCPICNTESHSFDLCKNARELSIQGLYEYLCLNRTAKPPLRSIINVLMLAAHQQDHWNLPLTKKFAKEGWRMGWRDPSLPGSLGKFASTVRQNWSELTRDLCDTNCTATDKFAVMFMAEDRAGISGFDCVSFDLLKEGKPPATPRGRAWSGRHHEIYARCVNYRPNQSLGDINEYDKEEHIKEQRADDSEHLKCQRERHGHQTRILQILLDHERRTQTNQSPIFKEDQNSPAEHTRILLEKMLDHESKAQKLECERERNKGLEKLPQDQGTNLLQPWRYPRFDEWRSEFQDDAEE